MGFSAYATILLHDGTVKRCEDLQPGDALRDHLSSHPAVIVKAWQEPGVGLVRITAGDIVLDCSGDVMLSTLAGPVEACAVQAGTSLQTASGPLPCHDTVAMPGDFMLYSIVTERPALVAINDVYVPIGRT